MSVVSKSKLLEVARTAYYEGKRIGRKSVSNTFSDGKSYRAASRYMSIAKSYRGKRGYRSNSACSYDDLY